MQEELSEANLDDEVQNAWQDRLSRHSRVSSRSKDIALSGGLEKGLLDGPLEDSAGFDPDQINIWSKGNRGIAMSYLAVGFGLYFIMTPIQFYMVDTLDATAGQQSVVIGLLHLPWALKICFGFITDSLPIYGYRRKSYFMIGWGLYVLCNCLLATVNEPSLPILACGIFLMTSSFVQADVCTDAILVERSKTYENEETRGTLQATGYSIRFFGSIIGAALGAVLYNQVH
jgi:MFS-type transporter involved in bile tolerance (Atg22 family)